MKPRKGEHQGVPYEAFLVRCPYCLQLEGQPCKSYANGFIYNDVHDDRMVEAYELALKQGKRVNRK